MSTLVLLALSKLLAGPSWIGDWLALSRDAVNSTSGHGFDAAYSHRFDAAYSHSFKELIGLIPGVGPDGANTAQLGIAVALAALIAWLWWRAPATILSTAAGGRLIAVTILAMLLAAPLLNTHDLTFWVVAAAFLLAPAPDAAPQARRGWAAVCWIGWLLPWLAVAMLLNSPFKPAAFFMAGLGGGLAILLLRRVRPPLRTQGPGA